MAEPALTGLSEPDDVVAWMSLLPEGRGSLRDFFLVVRRLEVNGKQVLSAEPADTVKRLGMTGELSQSFEKALAEVRTDYILYCIDDEQLRERRKGKLALKGSFSAMTRKKKLSGKELGKELNRALHSADPVSTVSTVSRGAASVPIIPPQAPPHPGVVTLRRRANAWITLKEGYLYKKKKVKKGFHKSTKLRFFSLKQDPVSGACQLEYSEGMVLKGILPLQNTEIEISRPGVFVIKSNDREVELATERNAVEEGTAWVLALQQATLTAKQDVRRTVVVFRNDDKEPGSQSPHRRRRGGDEEVDENAYGEMIDNARWAALRKGWERWSEQGKNMEGVGVEGDEEDEEVKLMRQMEVDEERRQEEERQQWLAKQQGTNEGDEDEDDDTASAAFSEDEEDWMAEMLAQEEAEELRQEQERLEWIAKTEATSIHEHKEQDE